MSFQRARISCYSCLGQEVGTKISLFRYFSLLSLKKIERGKIKMGQKWKEMK
jgi:hypothetical protein